MEIHSRGLNVAEAGADIMESPGKETDGRRSREGHCEETVDDGGRTEALCDSTEDANKGEAIDVRNALISGKNNLRVLY